MFHSYSDVHLAAIFGGLTTSIVGEIGAHAPPAVKGVKTFEQHFMREKVRNFANGLEPTEWLIDVIRRCCFSVTSVVCGVIYLDRLTKRRRVQFATSSWELVWTSLMVLSEKFWEDNYIHPGHVLRVTGFYQMFTPSEFKSIQFWLLDALRWSLKIERSEFDNWVHYLSDVGFQFAAPHMALPCPIFVQRPIVVRRQYCAPLARCRRSQSTSSTATPDDSSTFTGLSSTNSLTAFDDQGCDKFNYVQYSTQGFGSLWPNADTAEGGDTQCYDQRPSAWHRYGGEEQWRSQYSYVYCY